MSLFAEIKSLRSLVFFILIIFITSFPKLSFILAFFRYVYLRDKIASDNLFLEYCFI